MRNILLITLIVVAIIIFGLGFYFFIFQRFVVTTSQVVITPTPQPRPTNSNAVTPQTVAQGFYTAYIGCLLNPPSAATGQISQYCQTSTGYTTENFAQNLATGGVLQTGKDPVTCSSTVPQGTTFQTQSVTFDTALVIATEGFGGTGEKQVVVSLIKENNHWLVSNITCPAM